MTYPDHTHTMALLADWKAHHAAIEKLMNGIKTSIGLDIDGPMFDTVWKLFDAYTGTLTVEVGDFGGWLKWFAFENDMGAKAMAAGYDGQLVSIASLEDLYLLIEISRQREEK